MLKKSPLHHLHRSLGARFISHAGWDVPINFGSVKIEHHAVRQTCGVFDLSWLAFLDIQGSGAKPLLQYVLSQNVDSLDQAGKSFYSLMLNEDGGVIDDFIVHRLGDEHYRLVIDPERFERDWVWITDCQKFLGLEATASVNEVDLSNWVTLAIQGPAARAKTLEAFPELKASTLQLKSYTHVQLGEIFVAATGYTGEDGLEITLPAEQATQLWNALIAAGVQPCGFTARDSLRTEAGFRRHGRDMDESLSPFETGLSSWVDPESTRAFVGRDSLSAHVPQWQLLGLKLATEKGLLRDGQSILTEYGEGKITSATYSPTLGTYIAFALLPRAVAMGDILQASLRGHLLPVQVTSPRFVRYGKVLV